MTDEGFGNNLRAALERASAGGASAPIGRLPQITGFPGEVAESPGDMVVQRLAIPRVRIKQEVAAYIERNFLSRTNVDGSILGPSKETLIEELTGLFHTLEDQAGYIDEPKAPRRQAPSSARGQRAEVRSETQ